MIQKNSSLKPCLGAQLQTSVHLLCLCSEVAGSCSSILLWLVIWGSDSAQHIALIAQLQVTTSLHQCVSEQEQNCCVHDHLHLCLKIYKEVWGQYLHFISCSQWNKPQSSLGPHDAILMQIARHAQGHIIQRTLRILLGSLCTNTDF